MLLLKFSVSLYTDCSHIWSPIAQIIAIVYNFEDLIA